MFAFSLQAPLAPAIPGAAVSETSNPLFSPVTISSQTGHRIHSNFIPRKTLHNVQGILAVPFPTPVSKLALYSMTLASMPMFLAAHEPLLVVAIARAVRLQSVKTNLMLVKRQMQMLCLLRVGVEAGTRGGFREIFKISTS